MFNSAYENKLILHINFTLFFISIYYDKINFEIFNLRLFFL